MAKGRKSPILEDAKQKALAAIAKQRAARKDSPQEDVEGEEDEPVFGKTSTAVADPPEEEQEGEEEEQEGEEEEQGEGDEMPVLGGKKTTAQKVKSGEVTAPPKKKTSKKKSGAKKSGAKKSAAKKPVSRPKLSYDSEKIHKVKLSDLKVLKNRIRKTTPGKAKLEELQKSLELNGQLEPIIITTSNEVVQGNQRWKLAKELGWSTLNAIQLDPNIPPDQAEWAANTMETLSVLDKAVRIAHHIDKEKLTERDVASKLGISNALVHDYYTLTNMTDEERELLEDGKIGMKAMMTLLRKDDDIRLEAVNRAREGKPVTTRGAAAGFQSVVLNSKTLPEGCARGRVTGDAIELTFRYPVKKNSNASLKKVPKQISASWKELTAAVKVAWREL